MLPSLDLFFFVTSFHSDVLVSSHVAFAACANVSCQKSLYGTLDASQVFATYVEEGLNDHGFQRNAVVPCLYWGAMLEALGVHWGDDFIFGIPDDRRTISNN